MRNGQDPRRDLREYSLVRHAELHEFFNNYERAQRWRLERLSVRALALERTISRLRADVEAERGLRNVALHQLALASAAKDPAQFIRRWENEHLTRIKWGDE